MVLWSRTVVEYHNRRDLGFEYPSTTLKSGLEFHDLGSFYKIMCIIMCNKDRSMHEQERTIWFQVKALKRTIRTKYGGKKIKKREITCQGMIANYLLGEMKLR